MFGKKKAMAAKAMAKSAEELDACLQELFDAIQPPENPMKPVTKLDLSKGFDPIPDLKPGDKLRIKGDQYKYYTIIKSDTILTVNRVGYFKSDEHGSAVSMNDFTVIFTDNNKILEFSFDSRRFERVE